MNQIVSAQPLSPEVAAYVGIEWADQKHDVVLRSVGEPAKPEQQVIKSVVNALTDWIARMHERFGAKGKVLVCLEQSRGALIYQLMAYELFELYPINPSQLANYRKTFFSSGAKDDGPDVDLLSELDLNSEFEDDSKFRNLGLKEASYLKLAVRRRLLAFVPCAGSTLNDRFPRTT